MPEGSAGAGSPTIGDTTREGYDPTTGTYANPQQALQQSLASGNWSTAIVAQKQIDPNLSAYLQERQAHPGSALSKQMEAQLQPSTISVLQGAQNAGYNPTPTGADKKDPSWWQEWGSTVLIGGAVLGGALALGALGGAGAAGAGSTGASTAAGTAGTGGTLASTTLGTGAVATPAAATSGLVSGGAATGAATGGAAGTAATLAGTGAAATGGGLLSSPSLWSSLIGAGTQVAGSLINANAQQNASDASAKAAQDALDFEKQVYAQKQAQLSPYVGIGQGAVGKLAGLWGLSTTPSSTTATTTPAATTTTGTATASTAPASAANSVNGTGGNMAQLYTPPSATAQPPMVTVKAPTGETKQVPQDQAAYYLQKGATLVNTGGLNG